MRSYYSGNIIIDSPKDVKRLNAGEIQSLAEEIRKAILRKVKEFIDRFKIDDILKANRLTLQQIATDIANFGF